MKVCKNCQLTKPFSAFYRRNNGLYYTMCKDCYLEDKRSRSISRSHAVVDSKICRRCAEEKSASEFYKNYSQQGGIGSICRDCSYLENLEIKYKISNIDDLIAQRNGLCDICKTSFGTKPHVDHDHSCCSTDYTCGKCFRGLLCSKCNLGLGHFGDNVMTMNSAANYIASYNSSIGDLKF